MALFSWYCILGLLSVLIIGIDLAASPYIQFPFLFVIPVGLAAWHVTRATAIGFALALVASRFVLVITLEQEVMPLWAAGANALIRLLVLVGLAVLVATAKQQQLLAMRVRILEGLLPICMYCKNIRRADGVWEQIEAYISKHSAATFSHSLCERCAREHFEEYFPSAQRQDAGAGPVSSPADR